MDDAGSRRRILRLHAGLVAASTLCTTAFVIEVIRALDGNTLSWAYVFEWPLLFCYGVYMWHRLVREERGGAVVQRRTRSAPEDEAELAAWNQYLAELHASEARSPRPPAGPVAST
jgi:hypothetical protein